MPQTLSIKQYTDNPTTNIVLDTIERNKQALVFVNSKSSAEKAAEMIALQMRKQKIAVSVECKQLAEGVREALTKPTKQCERVAACIEYGIAFHHAGLVQKQKTAIEDAFRKGIIKCIACTPTLCLAPDTRIWDGISEKVISNMDITSVLALRGNELVPMVIEDINKLDNKMQLLTIVSGLGHFITVTENHRMLVKRNKKQYIIPAKQIRKEDKIATVGFLPFEETKKVTIKDFVLENNLQIENKEIDVDIAYFLGIMLGDGYSGAQVINQKIIYKASPCIVGKDEELFSHVLKICSTLGVHSRRRVSQGNVPQFFLGKDKWFREFLVRTGVDKGIKKHIAADLMKMELTTIASLLRGLFDTDGWVQKKQLVGFSSISLGLVKQIQKLLLRFGIISRMRSRKEGFMKIYERTYKTLPSFELTIANKKSILDFYRYVGFCIERKQVDLLNLVSKICTNIHYVGCQNCNYKIYKDLFSGRSKQHKNWGKTKLQIIKLLGEKEELGSKELFSLLQKIPRKKDLRLNHHYQLIKKRRMGNRSKTEWFWSLNDIGIWIFKNILQKNKQFETFFGLRSCPLCKKEMDWIIKKGWRSNNFEGHIFWDSITSIKETKRDTFVYDIVLPTKPKNEHMFVANGFIVHNSAGVDLPAYRAIIRDLKRFSKNWGQTSISVLEYHQMAGRAGRPGKDTKGEAITIAKTENEKENIYDEFIAGEVEDIYSKLAVEPVLRTYLLSLIATEYVQTKEQILSFFQKTFWAHQYKDMNKLEKIINKMLKLLEGYEFIETNGYEFQSAADVDIQKYKATLLGKRVAELYLDPLTAHEVISGMMRAKEKTFSPFIFLQLICRQLELRPLLGVKVKEYEEVEQLLLKWSNDLLVPEPTQYDPDYEEYLKSIKTAAFFDAWINETIEEELLEKFDVRPGEIHAKKERAVWLLHSAAELAKILSLHDVEKEFLKLEFRVGEGVKEELFSLLKFEGIGRVRARKLYDNKIKDVGDIKKVDVGTLTQLLGPKLAVSLKKQVGIDVEKIPMKENKRKGQISLMDY